MQWYYFLGAKSNFHSKRLCLPPYKDVMLGSWSLQFTNKALPSPQKF